MPQPPEPKLHALIEAVRHGRLPRREFVRRLVGAGLTAPMAGMLLLDASVAQTTTAPPYRGKRGQGGTLKALFWQGPTLLQPHLALGTKDQEAARVFYEPLAWWDAEGNLVPLLAAEIPTRANGGVAPDGRSITWKIKPGVTWHDGKPFTADDCVFTARFASDPASAATTVGVYKGLRVEKIDTLTFRVVFAAPTPFWGGPFCGLTGLVLPRHHFEPYVGAKSREAPANLKPVGTGPYRFVDFKPGDLVRAEANPNYHLPDRPFFQAIEIKGGGDAASAARAVLQTGEYDFAWNLQVEEAVLARLEQGGKGKASIAEGADIEYLLLNPTDPLTEVDGERSSIKTQHFAFTDPKVREAFGLLIDRQSIQDHLYGRAGKATANILNNPPRFRSPNTRFEFNPEKANALLDAAGWKRGADGVREKGGRKLSLLYQTSINPVRQKVQAIVKQAATRAGIALELKSVQGSVFFSTDAGNPDTFGKFYADLEMFTYNMTEPDPDRFMQQFLLTEIASKANNWQGWNIARYRNPEFDKAFAAARTELDLTRRAALFIRMNDLVVGDRFVVPLVSRPRVRGVGNRLVAPTTGWDLDFAALHDWFQTS